MHLNRFTDYSVRTLLLVAANPGRLVQLSEIADFYDISIDHLRKVVHNLSKLGYLQTQRGKRGGMCLALPAGQINLGQLIAQVEGRSPLIDCSSGCSLTPMCGLQAVLRQAEAAFYDVLEQHTLASLMSDKQMQRVLLLPSTNV